MFQFKNSTEQEMNQSFKGLGYKSANILKNLGLIAIGLGGLAILVSLVLLLKIIAMKNETTAKIYKFISARLFFNSIIRAMLETYLKLAVSTLIAI